MTAIPRDQWYVAAYSSEIGQELFSRTICGEPILFWRTRSRQVTAIPDRCVHRRFPLSQAPSRLMDDQVVCGYHGFTYGADGKCVSVPGQSRIPRTARLLPYPLVEQDSFVWVFIGDPAKADPARIPRARYLDLPDYTTVSGMEPLKARFTLLVDNLLDLSHETYLHAGYIGTPEVAETPITTEVNEEAGIVYVSRHMDDAESPPFLATSTGLHGRIARWQDIEYVPPCLYKLHSRVAPVGSVPNPDGTDPDGFHVEIVYAITPETENSTHDFWCVSRDFALDDDEVSKFLKENNRTVVLQDVAALNVLEQVVSTEPKGHRELSVNIDTGALATRRMLQRMTAAEPAYASTS
jgi:phenylpropionate dioxygenase-like ring-hydroxylating dioxygenase large terminal subunit